MQKLLAVSINMDLKWHAYQAGKGETPVLEAGSS